MNLSLSEEQLLIKNSAEKFFSDHLSFDLRRKAITQDNNIKDNLVAKSKELGWYALPFKPSYGGLDGSITDVMTLIEVFGSSLHIDPYIFSLLFPGMIIQTFCNDSIKKVLLKDIIEGKKKIVYCYAEPNSRYNFLDLNCKVEIKNNKYLLN